MTDKHEQLVSLIEQMLEEHLYLVGEVKFKDTDPIRCVACIYPDGQMYSYRAPARHHDVMRLVLARSESTNEPDGILTGFLTKEGKYVDRKEAAILALESGQVTKLDAPPWLFSEDLW